MATETEIKLVRAKIILYHYVDEAKKHEERVKELEAIVAVEKRAVVTSREKKGSGTGQGESGAILPLPLCLLGHPFSCSFMHPRQNSPLQY